MISSTAWLILGAVLGAILGVVADILFRGGLKRLVLYLGRLPGKLLRLPSPSEHPDVLSFGQVATEWVKIQGNGETVLDARYLETRLERKYVSLPDDLAELVHARRKELVSKKLKGEAVVWNGKRYALVSVKPTRYGQEEDPGLLFRFRLTDYASYLSVTRAADVPGLVRDAAGRETTIRRQFYKGGLFQVNSESKEIRANPYLAHSFGINLLAVTSDAKVVFTQRGPLVQGDKDCYSISVNEGMQHPMDLSRTGHPDFMTTAVRGLYEELGVSKEQIRRIEFLDFGGLAVSCEFALLGRALLRMTSDEVRQAFHQVSTDRELETRCQIYIVDYDPDAIVNFVQTHYPWTHNGLATLYYAMVAKFGVGKTRKVLADAQLEEHIAVPPRADGGT